MNEEKQHKIGLKSDGHLDENSIAACSEWLCGEVEELDENLKEHLSKCKECKQAVLDIAELISEENQLTTHIKPNGSKFEETCAGKSSPSIKAVAGNQFWKVAAIFIALITITALTLVIRPKKQTVLVDKVEQQDTTIADPANLGKDSVLIPSDSSMQAEGLKAISIESMDKNKYAGNFIPNAGLESLIGAQFRASGRPRINKPGTDTSLLNGEVLTFSGINPGQDKLEIQIMNNKAETVKTYTDIDLEKLEVEIDLDPGLYYWKLMGEDELHQIGKFIIKENNN